MARSTKTRGVVFGTQSMSSQYQQPTVAPAGSFQSQSNVATQFGASLSKTPVYLGRQKTMRRR